jgi:teichuronic acid biosynthesis glycosyltransferase TuaG
MLIKPAVTVIIPYKDKIKYLYLALKSIINQTYRNFQIIIIYDNKNTDDLIKIKKFINQKINKNSIPVKIIKTKGNLGAGYSRNLGLKNTKTKYVAFLDADDLWSRNKLKVQIEFMEKNKFFFSHTSYYIINSKNKIISYRIARSLISFYELSKSCDIGLSTVILNNYFLKKNNFYFPKIKTKEDFVLWLKISKHLKFVNGIDKKLTYYRKISNSLSSNKFNSLKDGYKVYRDYMNFSTIKSIYYLILLSLNFLKKNLILKK